MGTDVCKYRATVNGETTAGMKKNHQQLKKKTKNIDRKMSDEVLKTKYEIKIDRFVMTDFDTFPQSNKGMHALLQIL